MQWKSISFENWVGFPEKMEMKEICIAEALLANLENSSELQKTISSNFIWLFTSQTQSWILWDCSELVKFLYSIHCKGRHLYPKYNA